MYAFWKKMILLNYNLNDDGKVPTDAFKSKPYEYVPVMILLLCQK